MLPVDAGRNLAEEHQLVVLETLGKLDGVVVVKVLDRVTEGLVVLFLDEEVVDGIVDNLVVLGLDAEEEGLDERDVVGLFKEADDTGDVDAGGEDGEEVGQEGGLLLEVEVELEWSVCRSSDIKIG